MKFTLNQYQAHQIIKTIAQQLDSDSYTDCLEEKLELQSKIGNGKISGFHFSDGISFLLFDALLEEDWEIEFTNDVPAPLLFAFNLEGGLWHQFKGGNIRYQLNALQGSITACPSTSTQCIRLAGQRRTRFSILMVDRAMYLEKISCVLEQMPDILANIFTDEKAKEAFFYQSNYSIIASECINKISNDRHEGLVRSTYLEAKALELLSRQIRQYQDDLLYPDKQVMLRNYDVEKIKYARDILIKNLQAAPTIPNLAKQAGINQQKLKSGFKVIFDSTINQYLRNERLDQASLLLLKGHSVREAANQVGYTNLSHFARIFKEKYSVLPKAYSRMIRL